MWLLQFLCYVVGFNLACLPEAQSQSRLDTSRIRVSPANRISTGNLIFRSVLNYHKSWPAIQRPSGHSLMMIDIVAGTRCAFPKGFIDFIEEYSVFHARNDSLSPPPFNDWVSLNVELSLVCIRPLSGDIYLSTYEVVKPLRMASFDGRAGLRGHNYTQTGDLLLYGSTGSGTFRSQYCEATNWCEWALEHGLDGIYRYEMDSWVSVYRLIYIELKYQGSDIILCDWNNPKIKLVDHYSVERRQNVSEREWKEAAFQDWWALNRLQISYATSPPRQLLPDWSTFVSFDHPSLHSLDMSRRNQINGQYSLVDASQKDIARVKYWVKEASKRRKWTDDIDWPMVVERIVAHYRPILSELQAILAVGDAQQASRYQRLLNDLAMTAANTADGRSKCELMFLPTMKQHHGSSNSLLHASINEVLLRLCTLGPRLQQISLSDLRIAQTRVQNLLTWLDWPEEYRCTEVCKSNVRCSSRAS